MHLIYLTRLWTYRSINIVQCCSLSLNDHIGPVLGHWTPDQGTINFTMLVKGFIGIITMRLFFLKYTYVSRKDFQIINTFSLFNHIQRPRTWSPDHGTMNFPILLEGFIEIITLHFTSNILLRQCENKRFKAAWSYVLVYY